jgi:hypothetical protein
MTRNNWIAFAILASATTIGACSPRGGQAGQPDRTDQQNQASDQSAANQDQNFNNDRGDNSNMARDNSGRNASDMPVSLTIPAGTHLDLTINTELSSRKNKPGDTFTAKVASPVRDASGRVVIEPNATVNGNVVAVKPAPNRRTPGTLTIALSTIEMDGKQFPIRATIDSVSHEYRRQDVSGRDAAKVGAGAAAGAVVGQVLSKNTKGTVIGAVVGGIAGAGVAAETKDLDIVIPDGSHIVATISEPLRVAVDRDRLNEWNNNQDSDQRQTDTAKAQTKTRTY